MSLLLGVYLLVFFLSSTADLCIDWMNTRHLKKTGDLVPEVFRDIIDNEKLKNIIHYTIDNTKLSAARTIVGKVVFLAVILSGLLPFIAEQIKDLHFIIAGLLFFSFPALIARMVDIPFDFVHIFRLENKYGFNTRTIKTWLSDLLKALIITILLGSILVSVLLFIIQYFVQTWWVLAWLFFFLFQLLMTILYPTVIAPIFNRFTPIENESLAKKIVVLSEKEKLRIKGIFQMDAARRSRHTNAYFSGLGKTKRIVLFDTLLESHDEEEILAILAHEIGHLKGRHILKQLIIAVMVTLILFFIASWMIKWKVIYQTFGFSSIHPYVGIFLIAILWEPVEFFLSPIGMSLSRRFEREADQYIMTAVGKAEPFVRALKKMARDNLANLHPHPLYVRFHYSHPPLLDRIRYFKGESSQSG